MSAPATEVPAERKPLVYWDKKTKKVVADPLMDNNPITVQVLGICSALAVTVQVKYAIVMSLAVLVVLCSSNVIISILRNRIPPSIRMVVQLAVVATLVTLVDQVLQAFLFDVSKELSVFVGLIITNCIIMGRAEAFAMANPPWPSFLDGVGNSIGYGGILIVVAFFRELFGFGTLLGMQVVPDWAYEMGYHNMGIMVLSPGAFILLGLLIWAQRSITGQTEEA